MRYKDYVIFGQTFRPRSLVTSVDAFNIRKTDGTPRGSHRRFIAGPPVAPFIEFCIKTTILVLTQFSFNFNSSHANLKRRVVCKILLILTVESFSFLGQRAFTLCTARFMVEITTMILLSNKDLSSASWVCRNRFR